MLGPRALNEAYTKRCQNRVRSKSVRGSCGGPHCHGSQSMDGLQIRSGCLAGGDKLEPEKSESRWRWRSSGHGLLKRLGIRPLLQLLV